MSVDESPPLGNAKPVGALAKRDHRKAPVPMPRLSMAWMEIEHDRRTRFECLACIRRSRPSESKRYGVRPDRLTRRAGPQGARSISRQFEKRRL